MSQWRRATDELLAAAAPAFMLSEHRQIREYVAAGELFVACAIALHAAARERQPLPPELVATLRRLITHSGIPADILEITMLDLACVPIRGGGEGEARCDLCDTPLSIRGTREEPLLYCDTCRQPRMGGLT